MFKVTKTYGHNLGLSACFRQWKASSHCKFMHGYALQFKIVFQATKLNENNWVINFGGLKPIKEFLTDTFDHRTIIAADDPELETFKQLHVNNLIQLKIVPYVGCEAFAHMVGNFVCTWLRQQKVCNDVRVYSVECAEHSGNSAFYYPEAS